ncbi:hypothetical protein PCE1_004470 [Barthelona sp. PCE]
MSEYDAFVADLYEHKNDLKSFLLSEIQNLSLFHKIEGVNIKEQQNIRELLWLVLIKPDPNLALRYATYVEYCEVSKSVFDSIVMTTNRAFSNDEIFVANVDEKAIVRVLSAASHFFAEEGLQEFHFNQGMAGLAGMLLFLMPESQAFACFTTIYKRVPTYSLRNQAAIHAGTELVARIVQRFDATLYEKFKRDQVVWLFSFRLLMSFFNHTPPFMNSLPVLDFLFAVGEEYMPIVAAAQFVVAASSAKQHFDLMGVVSTPLTASSVIPIASNILQLVKEDEELHTLVLEHCTEMKTVSKLKPSFIML